MGDYTYFVIKGRVKEKYRHKIQQLYDYHNEDATFEKMVDDVGFDLFKDFKTGERSGMIFYGSVDFDEQICEYNEETGDWHIECDIKDYSENGKPKNSMQMFVDLFPELFEDGMYFSSQYEYLDVPWKGELRNGELVCINMKEYNEEIKGLGYGIR